MIDRLWDLWEFLDDKLKDSKKTTTELKIVVNFVREFNHRNPRSNPSNVENIFQFLFKVSNSGRIRYDNSGQRFFIVRSLFK